MTREGCELRERFQPTLVSALVSVRVPTIFQCWVRRRGDSNSASKTRADHRRWDQRQHVRSPTAYMLPCPVGLRIGSGPWLSQILRRNKPKRRADNRRNRFEDGSKAVPGCSLLLQAVPGKNEIREFVRHGAPGYPTGVHGLRLAHGWPIANAPGHVWRFWTPTRWRWTDEGGGWRGSLCRTADVQRLTGTGLRGSHQSEL